ncbi:MAG: ComEC/Rec2 family competence protein [Candidatus Liptonbacteria bacterium]|nr:ComEC/Rec2 family competence protein [Candidatus Liptonbacteria bacterium]
MVLSEPKLSEKFQSISLKLNEPLAGEITIIASLSLEINYGDIIEARGEIKVGNSEVENPVSFFPEIKIVSRSKGFWLKEKLLGVKKAVVSEFKSLLPRDSAALLSGLTLGWRGNFTDDLKKDMSMSGTTHLVALSGYNITILVLVVAGTFGYFLPRRTTFWLTTAIIILFILMVGGEASVVRAAIMGFIALLAKEAGRKYSVRNAIALTAATMILADPRAIFDVGFQLSFLSLIGIVYLAPPISNFLRMEEEAESFLSWKENAVTTLSAQLMVAPILIHTFGNFSLTSIAANILILEFVPVTMLLGFALAAVSYFLHYAGFIISFFENVFLQYELAVIRFFANFNMPVLNELNSSLFFVFYYLALAAFLFYRSKSKLTEIRASGHGARYNHH